MENANQFDFDIGLENNTLWGSATYYAVDFQLNMYAEFGIPSSSLDFVELGFAQNGTSYTANFDFDSNLFGQALSHDFGNGINGALNWNWGANNQSVIFSIDITF